MCPSENSANTIVPILQIDQERPKFASVMNGGGGEVGAVHQQQQQQGKEEGSGKPKLADFDLTFDRNGDAQVSSL